MGKCVNHPDRDTNLVCMKHGVYMCEDCIACRDPKIHCKFRPSCPIWFMEKRGGKTIDESTDKEKTEGLAPPPLSEKKSVVAEANNVI